MHMNEEPSNVISIKPGQVIRQSELQEFIILTQKLQQAQMRWDEKKQYLTRALAKGAEVEYGMHEAFLSRLVVR